MSQLVSILIPAYNAEKWIGQTIKSALCQTWPNKEIIIVDDGSSDNTLRLCKAYESKTVKVINQRNSGACVARNTALSLAQGSYIQWLDADDLLHPEKIAKQLQESGSGEDSSTLLTGSWGKFYFRHNMAKMSPDSLWQDAAPIDWLMRKFIDNAWMNPTVWLVSRRLTELAGSWDERLTIDQDGEYICRVVAASDGVRFVRNAISYYRQASISQLSRTDTRKSHESLLLSKILGIQHLRSLEISERTRNACLLELQRLLTYFYLADEADLVERTKNIALEIGGELMPPALSTKEDLMGKLLGIKKGMKVMRMLRKLRLAATVKWDEIMYMVAGSAGKDVDCWAGSVSEGRKS